MASILIMGCGDIGGALAKNLSRKGHEVTGLRRTQPVGLSPVKFIQADVTNADEMDAVALDYDQLVYILSPSGRSIDAYQAVFEVGVDNLLNSLRRQGLDRPVTFVSSSRVYGECKGEQVNEKTTANPKGQRGQLLLDAENKFLSYSQQTTIVRFSGIYGRSNYFIEQLKKGTKIQKNPPYYTNRIHRDDCVGVLEHLLNKKIGQEQIERIYLATDCAPTPKWEVASYLVNKLALQPCEVLTNIDQVNQNKQLDNSRICASGYSFIFKTYKEGYEEAVGGKN